MPGLGWSFLGCVDYGAARRLQERLAEQRRAGRIGDLLLLLEHPPVVTIGRNARDPFGEEDAGSSAVPRIRVDRGGAATYHGPGQLVVYPVVELRSAGRGVRRFVDDLEETLCAVAREFGVEAFRRAGFPGAWVEGSPARKLGSVGIGVRRGVSLHGASLNVSRASARGFDGFDPCGLPGVVATSLEDEAPNWVPGLGRVAESFVDGWARITGDPRPERVAIEIGSPEAGLAAAPHAAGGDEVPSWT